MVFYARTHALLASSQMINSISCWDLIPQLLDLWLATLFYMRDSSAITPSGDVSQISGAVLLWNQNAPYRLQMKNHKPFHLLLAQVRWIYSGRWGSSSPRWTLPNPVL